MREIVGDMWYEVALAACNLYHGFLHLGQGKSVKDTMRMLREAAFSKAETELGKQQYNEDGTNTGNKQKRARSRSPPDDDASQLLAAMSI